jgi:fatty-acyl-CoA synthase
MICKPEFRYPLHFRTLLEAFLAAPPEQPFVTTWNDDDHMDTMTFGEFWNRARGHASYFRQHNVKAGDRIILIMPQGISLMAAFVGAMLLRAVPAILAYPNFKVEPTKYSFGLSGVSANLRARLVVLDEAFPEDLLGHVAFGGSAELVRCPEAFELDPQLPEATSEPGDLAFIQHSAGTTGLQKGVALSHASVIRQLNHLATALNINGQDRIYSWLPLYHDMGLIACFLLPLFCHLPVVMQSPTGWVMHPGTMLQLISEYRCTLCWVPNFALQFLARRVPPEDRKTYDLSSLRVLINCSEPVRAQSMDEFFSAFASCGLQTNVLQSSYAMAETVFAVTHSEISCSAGPRRIWVDTERFRNDHHTAPIAQPADSDREDATCFVSSGKCLPGSEVRIVSSTGEELPEGAVGEICIRSDSLFDGYYNRPDLTAKALRDGSYRSGDLGFCREGELYVVGRKNDLIIIAGKNVYPQDVEEIACNHPAIHDGRAVAFGLFNPDLGTEEIVVVTEVEEEKYLKDSAAIERALRNAVVAELNIAVRAIYLKPPRWIVKSTAGKPARSTTREKLLAEHPELVAKNSSLQATAHE